MIITHYTFLHGYALSQRNSQIETNMWWSEPVRWPDDAIWTYIPSTWQPVRDETT